MTSFCALLSGITVTQVSGSDRHLTINVVGLDTRKFSIETFPSISLENETSNTDSVANGLNTYKITKPANDPATTIRLNIKLLNGATLSSYNLIWSQFKGFSTSTLSSMRPDNLVNTRMIATLENIFTQPITFRISSLTNETVRVTGTGTPETIITAINGPSQTQTPPSVNSNLTFETTITPQASRRGARYLLMATTTINSRLCYILAEPFVFTTTFTYEQVAFFEKMFSNFMAAGVSIIDGGIVGGP